MKDYQLIIRIPFPAMDDPAARISAQEALRILDVKQVETLYSAKLQRVEEGKPPVGINL